MKKARTTPEQRLLHSVFRTKGPKRTPKRRLQVRVYGATKAQRKAMARLYSGNRAFWGNYQAIPRYKQRGRYKRWKASRKPRREPKAA